MRETRTYGCIQGKTVVLEGNRLAELQAGNSVAWITGRREPKTLKSLGRSHWVLMTMTVNLAVKGHYQMV
jgi:hypothetical protein